jgi:hypothetical protein
MGAIVIRTRYDEGTESAEVATSGVEMKHKYIFSTATTFNMLNLIFLSLIFDSLLFILSKPNNRKYIV